MIDYHNRCEWVNISSGTGSLGCPGQNAESHKTVVCVLLLFMVDDAYLHWRAGIKPRENLTSPSFSIQLNNKELGQWLTMAVFTVLSSLQYLNAVDSKGILSEKSTLFITKDSLPKQLDEAISGTANQVSMENGY